MSTDTLSSSKIASKGLGKGLSALIGDLDVPSEFASPVSHVDIGEKIVDVLVDDVVPGPFQPRKFFSESSLKDLAQSIKEKGLVQPILVRPLIQSGQYELVAGERRWRASKMAGLKSIPALVRIIDDQDAMELALIENIQRQDLNPIEEAEAYQQLISRCGYTQEQLSIQIGKSRSHIANMMRLLTLPDSVKEFVMEGKLTMGHARALVGYHAAEAMAESIIANEISVREVENLIRTENTGKSPKSVAGDKESKLKRNKSSNSAKDEDIIAIEQSLSTILGMRVSVFDTPEGGALSVYFNSLEQLDMLIQKLTYPK